jgi:hypothetical protein
MITSVSHITCTFAKLMWRLKENGEAFMQHSQKLMIKVDR